MIMKQLRESDKLTQKEFGEIFNCSQQAIQQYEAGKRQIPIQLAIDISNYYKIPLDMFFERKYEYK